MNSAFIHIRCLTSPWSRAVAFFVLVSALFSCTRSSYYEKHSRSLDSLSGALNLKIQELNSIDTVLLHKAINKFENYSHFISEHVKDTLSKNEADQLQQFFSGGKNLVYFMENRRSLLSRGQMITQQLSRLKKDISERTISEEKTREYFENEKSQTEQLIKGCYGQQQLFQSGLQEFRLSLSDVESIIRLRNNNQMPTIIKDSIPL